MSDHYPRQAHRSRSPLLVYGAHVSVVHDPTPAARAEGSRYVSYQVYLFE